jgi:hypothetical protein
MTPEEERLRDMWIAELWPTVHQYIPPAQWPPTAVENGAGKPRKKPAA